MAVGRMYRGDEPAYSRALEYFYGRKEPGPREKFVSVSNTNVEIARGLLENAKRLSKARRYNDAEILTDLAKDLLDNNANLLDAVGDVLDKK